MPADSYSDNSSDAESAVRQYLLYLDDPSKLRDEAEIQRKTKAVLEADDPIEKLKAVAELERVAKVDETPLRENFVAHASDWAAAENIPVNAFRELGVPDDVLRAAGFDVPVAGERRRRAGVDARQRAKAVPVEEIKSFVLSNLGTFVLSDVQAKAGGSPATVRKAVEELVESGHVERIGPVSGYSGRGRAPIQYNRP